MSAIGRHAFAWQAGQEHLNDFRVFLGQAWKQITELLDAKGAGNFSLWQIGDLVFGYYETDAENPRKLSAEQKAAYDKLAAKMEELGTWISAPAGEMRLMYQDFGVVRESKELIRHRVFATQLRGDFQEEYKRRHDALVMARHGEVTKGPDSNFSIWNAGRYIFGYDEIDVTMESAPTPQSRQETIDWETKMLEIMEWFSDDVDWITGERHPHVVRLASWH